MRDEQRDMTIQDRGQTVLATIPDAGALGPRHDMMTVITVGIGQSEQVGVLDPPISVIRRSTSYREERIPPIFTQSSARPTTTSIPGFGMNPISPVRRHPS